MSKDCIAHSDVVLLNAKMQFMEEKFDKIEKLLLEHMRHEEEQMDKLIETMEKRYASKWVEKVLLFMVTAT